MGWRFRRSVSIVPGVRINLGKRGATSLSVGGRGATLNFGKRGITSTTSIPGTGLSYQHRITGWVKNAGGQPPALPTAPTAPGRTKRGLYVVVGACALVGYLALRAPSPPSQAVVASTGPTTVWPQQPAHLPSNMSTGSAAAPTVTPASAVETTKPIAADVAETAGGVARQLTLAQTANVRATPSMSGAVLRTIPKGTSVQVLKSDNGWFQIDGSNGQPGGWVHGSLLK